MMTKIDAGVIATSSGCAMIIASGLMPQPLSYLQQGGQHTLFFTSNRCSFGTPRMDLR
jgi:glutamate 5-kinase